MTIIKHRPISTLATDPRKVLRKNTLQGDYYQVGTLLEDPSLKDEYLNALEVAETFSDVEIDLISANYSNLLEVMAGFREKEALDLLVDIWTIVFNKKGRKIKSARKLQQSLLQKRQQLVDILMDARRYDIYETLIQPLSEDSSFSEKRTQSDDFMIICQLKYQDGKLSLNKHGILRYLRDEYIPMHKKRQFLERLTRSGIIYASNDEERYLFIKYFMEFSKVMGDIDMNFVDSQFKVYEKVLRLMAIPPEGFEQHITELYHQFVKLDFEPEAFNNLLTSLMSATASAPNYVLKYWQYKVKHSRQMGLAPSRVLNYKDLKYAMQSLLSMNYHKEVEELYWNFPTLHDDDQIEVLLELCAVSKDWEGLQKRFEEMYGRGNLPLTVHYAIVMNALATVGAKQEVDNLFQQLIERKLEASTSVFISLINSRLYYNDIDGAKKCIDLYLSLSFGEKEKDALPKLYSLIFDVYIRSSSLQEVMDFFESTLKRQAELGVQLINSKVIVQVIDMASSNYGLREIERLKSIAEYLNLGNNEVYLGLIRTYTRMDQFERADEISYEAHRHSEIPFNDSKVYAAQLRNFRFWQRSSTHSEKREYYRSRMTFISFLADDVRLEKSLALNAGFFTEVIKYLLSEDNVKEAYAMLRKVEKLELLRETHYVPFLKYFSRTRNSKSRNEVMKLYQEMIEKNITVSSLAYVFLLRVSLETDHGHGLGFKNSLSLLETVFKLHGIALTRGEKLEQPQVSALMLYQNYVNLCRMLSDYIITTKGDSDMLMHFMEQVRSKLGEVIGIDFTITSSIEMAKVYESEGNKVKSQGFIDFGMVDLRHFISRFHANYPFKKSEEVVVPRALSKPLRTLITMKMRTDSRDVYIDILNESHDLVTLSGIQYNQLMKGILPTSNINILNKILFACEHHLVSGNWVEIQIMNKLQYLYKLIIYHLIRLHGENKVMSRYSILNNYYNIKSLSQLDSEFAELEDPYETLKYEVETHIRSITTRNYSVEDVIRHIPKIFAPERHIRTRNKISHTNSSQLWWNISKHCKDDILKAYDLMQEYPNLMEYLMYNNSARYRMICFRDEINKIRPPRSREGYNDRRFRTISALTLVLNEEQPNPA
ncbi:hypothetical protein G9P44_001665 [Scheffersomyces stipitis]|nr:hypothetical protein G9P44_001665 [Scheffersomyces stipitis]